VNTIALVAWDPLSEEQREIRELDATLLQATRASEQAKRHENVR